VGIRAAGLLERSDLAAPELLDAEVLAVLRRMVLAGRLAESRASEAITDLVSWPVDRLRHVQLLEAAWALRGHVSAYDALYVAAARVRRAAIVTTDGPLARAPGLGVVIHDVRAG
jgi:predicted nucleic acid-binding protein